MIRIRDKPPVSAYPTIDRITGVLCAGILLGCLLACLGPGQGREAHYISNEAEGDPGADPEDRLLPEKGGRPCFIALSGSRTGLAAS